MMIMRNAGEKRLQNFVTTFCALFFALFSFTFVAVYKSPLLQIVYDNVATGRLEYDGWVVSGILTAILVGLALWMNRFAKFQREWTAMAFLPSAFILAFVTDIDRSIFTGEKSYAVWGWALLISLFLYLFLSFVLHRVLFEKIKNPTMVANRIVWRNLILFVLLFAGVGALSGGDRSFMCEAIQYRLFKEGNVDEAVLVGKHYTSASQELTAQSAFLLSLKGKLGDKIFEYPNNFGAEGLLPSVKQSSPIASDTIYAHIGFEPLVPNHKPKSAAYSNPHSVFSKAPYPDAACRSIPRKFPASLNENPPTNRKRVCPPQRVDAHIPPQRRAGARETKHRSARRKSPADPPE